MPTAHWSVGLYFHKSHNCIFLAVTGFDTEDEMVGNLTSENGTADVMRAMTFIGGIVFDDPQSYKDNVPLPHNLSYTIRYGCIV